MKTKQSALPSCCQGAVKNKSYEKVRKYEKKKEKREVPLWYTFIRAGLNYISAVLSTSVFVKSKEDFIVKKLMIICFCLLFSVLSVLSCMNFSYGALEGIEGDMTNITIEKPEGMSNESFLQTVDAALSVTGEDIMLRKVSPGAENKMLYTYYKTNHSDTFLDVKTETGTCIVLSGECFSTTPLEDVTCHDLYIPSLLQDIAIFNWKEAANLDLSRGVFYIRTDSADSVLSVLGELEYSTERLPNAVSSGKLPVLLFAFIPGILLIVSIVFYSLSAAKKTVLCKVDGFSNRNVFFAEVKANAAWFVIWFTVIQLITTGIVAFIFRSAVRQFFVPHMQYLLVGVGCLLIGLLIAASVIASQSRMEYVKGKVSQKGIYAVSMITKCAFVAFLLFFLSIGIRNVLVCNNTYQNEKFLADKLDGYVCMPINVNNTSYKDREDSYLQFYKETEQAYNGVLIETSNYAYDLISGGTLADIHGQTEITINENYLEFNPIYDMSGQRIYANMLSPDAVNILIPESKKNRADEYTEKAQLWFSSDAEILFYDDKASEIYSYNASVISEKHGTISSPIIIVANDAVLTPQYTTSCFTQASYFIRPHTDDAYTELAPLLRELDLESTIPALTYVSDGFREAFNHSLQMLILYGTQSLMLLLGLICLIVFSAKTFCENYRLKIAICLIEGFSAMHCCKRHVFINTGTYLVSLLFIAAASLLTQIAFSFTLLIIAFMLDQLLTVFLCGKFSAGKLYSVVKGA